MRVYLGGEVFVKDDEIIGVFDMDSATISKSTRDFLGFSENEKKIVYSNLYEFPRSFVVTKEAVYITPIACSTLNRRIKKNLF